jgi:hypothetical protein
LFIDACFGFTRNEASLQENAIRLLDRDSHHSRNFCRLPLLNILGHDEVVNQKEQNEKRSQEDSQNLEDTLVVDGSKVHGFDAKYRRKDRQLQEFDDAEVDLVLLDKRQTICFKFETSVP